MRSLINMLVYCLWYSQLHVDFSPTVVAIDNVDETISSSYYSHNPNALSTQHRITLNSILSVVSESLNKQFSDSHPCNIHLGRN